MAVTSKFFQVTDQLLIEYKYDQYNASGTKLSNTEDYQLYYHKPYVVRNLDNTLQVIDNCTEDNLFNSLSYQQFVNNALNKDSYWLGYKVGRDRTSFNLSAEQNAKVFDSLVSKGKLNPLTSELNFMHFTQGSMAWDKIRIYFITGYIMNSINGFSLKVSATRKASDATVYSNGEAKTIRVSEDVTLCNFFFDKNRLSSSIKWLVSPFYMSGKFYDRFIEIEVPSTYSLGLLNKTNPDAQNTIYNLLNISTDSLIKLDFNVLSDDVNIEDLNYAEFLDDDIKKDLGFSGGLILPNMEENSISGSVALNSNADYFNVRIYEDENSGSIVYYPIWGDNVEAVDFNINIMNNIESGSIPLLVNGFLDEGTDIDEFTDVYGEAARKWIIYNEVIVTYTYQPISYQNSTSNQNYRQEIKTSETFTNIIDYTDKTSADGPFWRSFFRPIIKKRVGYECNFITLNYNCHLINRMNNSEVVKTASITVNNAESKYSEKSKMIDVSNISKWKIVNKINNTSIGFITPQDSQNKNDNEKIVRTFYNATNIVIKDLSNTNKVYSQGSMILYLFKTTTNYLFQLYVVDPNSGVRVPFDLTGPYSYKLIFPILGGSGKIEKDPLLTNLETNLGLGTLLFNITENEVKQIMEVPSSERYFALIIDNSANKIENSTLYEGLVEYQA